MDGGNKAALKSKTMWTNLIGVIAGGVGLTFPEAGAWIAANAAEILIVLSALNVILRWITKDKILWIF